VGRIHQLVTQNVDGLHQRAGARRVIDLHGCLGAVDCQACGRRYQRGQFQQRLLDLNLHHHRLSAVAAPDGDADVDEAQVAGFRVPECEQCGGVLKPAVVFFGENVPRARVERAYARLAESDAMLVVGSSLMVYSGFRFCRAAAEQGKPIAAINLGRSRADGLFGIKIEADCGQVLEALVAARPAVDRASRTP
jgi:NAD-dependent SIR2 family protein deacetylase